MPITQDLRGSKLLLLGAEPLAARVRKHEAIPKPNKQTIHTSQTSFEPSRTLASYQIQIPLLGSPEGQELVSAPAVLVLQSPPALRPSSEMQEWGEKTKREGDGDRQIGRGEDRDFS